MYIRSQTLDLMIYFRYTLALLPAVLAILGNLLGTYFTLGNMIFSMVVLVGLDWLIPENKQKSIPTHSSIPDNILLAAVAFHSLLNGLTPSPSAVTL